MNNNNNSKYESLISKLKTSSSVIYNGNEHVIKSKYHDIKDLMLYAQQTFLEGDFPKASKIYRQLASLIHELYFKIENKGTYSSNNILNNLSGKEWLRHTKSWIVMDGKPSDIPHEIKDHPASYPPDLIEYFIEFFTKKGEWVFDPFMGIGSTAVASLNLKRNCWGTEINPKYYNYAKDRINLQKSSLRDLDELRCEIFNTDCRELIRLYKEQAYPPIDFCITSPPYWNILGTSRGGVKSTHKKRIENGLDEKYSDNPNDIGNISNYEEYLEEMESIFNIILQILKVKGYLILIIQNVRPKGGVMIPIAWDLANLLKKAFKLRQEYVWCQNQKKLGIWGYPKTYVSNVHHHYCLVLQK